MLASPASAHQRLGHADEWPPLPSDVDVQEAGTEWPRAFCSATRAVELYPAANQHVTDALKALERVTKTLHRADGRLAVHRKDGAVFVNGARVIPNLANWGILGGVRGIFERLEIDSLEVHPDATRDDWAATLVLFRERTGLHGEDVCARVAEQSAGRIQVRTVASSAVRVELGDSRAPARRTYGCAVQAAREAMNSARMGKGLSVRRLKRAVQDIVDQAIRDETSILAMTTLRDYDEYTFTHCVNVCIFSVMLGKRLGLSKPQLAELGLGATLHDVGKLSVPIEVTTKPGKLSDDEWALIREHPTEGMLALMESAREGAVSPRAFLIAYEHHMRVEGAGYPVNRRGREPTLFSRIVAVADSFDAATTRRSYQQHPSRPDEVLREMGTPARGLDPLLVKAFVSVTGIYPIGTVVILDTYEIGVVAKPGPPQAIHRPLVYLIFDDLGMPISPAPLVDLMDMDSVTDGHRRTVIKTSDPEKYKVRVADYVA